MLFTFGIQPPHSISDMLGSWIVGFTPMIGKQLLLGVVALCWVIWLTCNDAMFCRIGSNSYLLVVFRGTYWEDKTSDFLKKLCRYLEGVLLAFDAQGVWNFR